MGCKHDVCEDGCSVRSNPRGQRSWGNKRSWQNFIHNQLKMGHVLMIIRSSMNQMIQWRPSFQNDSHIARGLALCLRPRNNQRAVRFLRCPGDAPETRNACIYANTGSLITCSHCVKNPAPVTRCTASKVHIRRSLNEFVRKSVSGFGETSSMLFFVPSNKPRRQLLFKSVLAAQCL